MKINKAKIISPLLCVLAAVIWGVSFVAQSEGASIGPITFIGIRSALAGATLLIYVLISDFILSKKTGVKIKLTKTEKITTVKCGILCGLALLFASIVQQAGIGMLGTDTSVGRAGFITAIYIILVPIMGIFMKKKVSPLVWLSVIIALTGLYIIAVPKGSGKINISKADLMLLLCAFLFALHIVVCDITSSKADCVKISCVQFITGGILGIIAMFVFENPDINLIKQMIPELLYSGVLSGGVAFTLQIVSQKNTQPTLAALLLSLESVFATVADWLIRKNMLSSREIIGCVIVFTAIILAQLPVDIFKKKNNIKKKGA